MLPECAKTRRRKDRWMQVRAGRLEGSWPGFGLDVGTIGRIAFSQNSSRGRRQEEALASCRQTTADQPCQARPSPPDQTRWIRPSPAANLQPAPRNTEPSAGAANRHRLDPVAHSDGGPCHPGPPRLAYRTGQEVARWSARPTFSALPSRDRDARGAWGARPRVPPPQTSGARFISSRRLTTTATERC